MIDQKINDSLKELEASLRNIDSARKQVEKTANLYDGLNDSTKEYVSQLGNLSNRIKNLIDTINQDYQNNAQEFKIDHEYAMTSIYSASKKLSETADIFKNTISDVNRKIKWSIALNIISILSIIALVTVILFLIK